MGFSPSTASAATFVALSLGLGSCASVVSDQIHTSNLSSRGHQLASLFDTSASGCAVSTAIVPHQGGQLAQPTYQVTQIGLGIGTQNYSCSSAGNYTSIGAVAELYDVSCEYLTAGFTDISAEAYRVWNAAPTYYTESTLIDVLYASGGMTTIPAILGEHYFVPSLTGSGVSPKWDFTSKAFVGNSAAYVIGKVVDDIPSPSGSSNIDWLYLTNVQGGLAQEIYRTNTMGGQPPHSCAPGSAVVVKYTSIYYFTGGLE
ncbi:hypothetical protein J3R30DRAFT_54931 [Lentinula aciculospora]|uniref:Malate dehydrogenase n=1 Tax=Lentinula aciculospora TaxID=153920 RepID=A0A9W9ATM7_9AGAR|nr:hypothetical protein J3R30DRAFT_54931 [Lentinula aciculospora]